MKKTRRSLSLLLALLMCLSLLPVGAMADEEPEITVEEEEILDEEAVMEEAELSTGEEPIIEEGSIEAEETTETEETAEIEATVETEEPAAEEERLETEEPVAELPDFAESDLSEDAGGDDASDEMAVITEVDQVSVEASLAEELGFQQDGDVSGYYEYSVNGNKATITKYTGSASSVTIPVSLSGYEVVAIGDSAFADKTSLASVTIPVTVQSLGRNVFKNCTELTSVTINGDLKYAGDDPQWGWYRYSEGYAAFYNAGVSSGMTVTFGSGVTSVPARIFATDSTKEYGKYARVKKVVIGENVTSIGEDAFYNCYDLVEVTLGKELRTIGGSAFENTSITTIVLPSKLSTIGTCVFKNCTKLTSVTINGDLKYAGDDPQWGWYRYSEGYAAFYNAGVSSGMTVTFGSGVTSVPARIFATDSTKNFGEYAKVTKVVIPKSITSIGQSAFYNCHDLSSVQYAGSKTSWGQINIDGDNTNLTDAKIAYAQTDPIAISNATITVASQTYTGKALTPAPTVTVNGKALVKGADYTVTYANNTNAGTATVTVTGKGSYTGTKSATFKISPASISGAAVTAANQTYTGKALTPAPTVTVNSKVLVKGADYTVTCANNTNVGTATITVAGQGNYTGTATGTFTIAKAKDTITAKNFTKTYKAKAQSFKLGATTIGGKLTYKSNNKNITVSKAGKVTIKKGYVGKATITITSAATKNCEKNTKKITVTVNPAGVKLSSVKNTAKKKVTVKWKKSTNTSITGYQVQYSLNADFSGAKTVKVKGVKNVSKVISKLTKGKTYYIRVRTYQTVSKKTYYSAWSAVKTVKVKK